MDEGRLKALRRLLRARRLDGLLLTAEADIRYLTGYRGEEAALVVRRGRPALVTDGRYAEEAGRALGRSGGRFRLVVRRGPLAEAVAGLFRRPVALGVEEETVSHRLWKALRRALPPGSRVRSAGGLVAGLRRHKDAGELRAVRRAVRLAEEGFLAFRRRLRAGLTERQAARLLEDCLLEAGSEGFPFPVIVAAGPNSSRPHHRPTGRKIRRGELVLVDWGARYRGYCSDLTRVLFLGKIRPAWERAYEAVLEAHLAACRAARPGAALGTPEEAARRVLRERRLEERFLHGLGHGIGLEVHEPPALSAGSKGRLEPGDCFTVEPGVYLAGRFGIRLEDDYRLAADRIERLSSLPRELSWAAAR